MKNAIRREASIFFGMMLVSLCVWSRQATPSQAKTPAAVPVGRLETILPGEPEWGLLPETEEGPDVRKTSELLVDAIVQIESSGDFLQVGQAGERGLMQIKSGTWRQTTRRMYGRALPFDWAFDPELNRRVGRAYLAELHAFLLENRSHWRSDERSLLLAAYNAGPHRVLEGGFKLDRMPATTQDYVERATALHEYYLADHALEVRRLLAAGKAPSALEPRGS